MGVTASAMPKRGVGICSKSAAVSAGMMLEFNEMSVLCHFKGRMALYGSEHGRP